MPRPPVYNQVMEVVERRVAEGDYMLKDLPGERKLADELGVSYMTARKAVSGLIDKGVLTRRDNGTLIVHPKLRGHAGVGQIAMLTPAYPSTHLVHCRLAVTQAAEQAGLRFRPVEYVHWYDPVVIEALQGSDGLIVIPNTEPVPQKLLTTLAGGENRVVIFDDDWSELGVPSIRLFARSHINAVFDHLWDLGHRRIDCLNTQGHNPEIDRRIEHWRAWLAQRAATGRLIDQPAEPYQDATRCGYEAMGRAINTDDPAGMSAVVCTTQPGAIGAIRACIEAGLTVGRDISVCTMNNEPTGRFFTPSLTGLEVPDVAPILRQCFAWLTGQRRAWAGKLLVVPPTYTLLHGESTGPAAQSSHAD